ncbi:hypothetical protein HMPREF1051_0077 [Neisseria sicca VK64]|uniref:Uncharacterized protein n=1 Tax=Neisseria sicca VK64 TaxID=1095748 RepID=I2NDZ7_NEISI|nr:hypothetical protein HMPREF1051_0077 [Neisseria sicca VK64]
MIEETETNRPNVLFGRTFGRFYYPSALKFAVLSHFYSGLTLNRYGVA